MSVRPMAVSRKWGLRLGLALVLSTLSGLVSGGCLSAATASSRYYIPRIPDRMEDLDFFLTTAGVGWEVNDRFGHTGIRVINRLEGTDVIFNWGQFSFEDPTFLWKFFRGQLDYSMGVRSLGHEVSSYRHMNRLLRMEHLHLSPKQKRFLSEKLAWNSDPANRIFSYQYWYKNCSTIPRDYLNEALGGKIYAQFGQVPAHKVYRDYVRGNLALTPFVVPVLDVLMNSNIDRPISVWEDMFLPSNLRAWLLTQPAIDDDGREIAGQHLLEDSSVLNDTPEMYDPPFNDYLVELMPLMLPLLLALGLFLRYQQSGSERARLWAYRCLGAGTVFWGLLAGIFGLTLLINWGFSGHPDGWHNTNLLLFWPIDLVFVPLGWRLLRSGAPVLALGPYQITGRRFCLCHALSLALLCALTAAGIFTQNIWHAALWFGLPLLALLALLALYAFVPACWQKAPGPEKA